MDVRKIKKIIIFVMLLAIITVSNQFTLAYLLDKTSPLVSKFIPGENETNDLVISKLIEHSLGDSYVIPEDMEFDFQIDLGEYYANQSIVTSLGELKTNEKGILNVKVKPNVDLVISEIEDGTKVVVTEVIDKPGFSAKDELVKEVTISSDESSKIEFINKYTPELVTGENIVINGKKVLDGREWQNGDSFTFKLEYLNESSEWISLGKKTITYDKDNADFNKFNYNEVIKSFEFKNVGTYKFRLSEVVGSLEDVDYDKTINSFNIVVGDNTMDGMLEIENISGDNNVVINKSENNFEIKVTFNNKYVVPETPEIEYNDKVEDSVLVEDIILVKEDEYTIETVISKFDGLSDDYTYVVYDKDGKEYKDGLVRTGDYVVIKDNNNEYRYDVVLSGDTSGDGLITPLDYVKIKNHIIGNTSLPGNVYELAADMSGDGDITPLDYVKVKNYILNGGN